MAVIFENLTNLNLGIPEPINDFLGPRESKTYTLVEWDAVINDSRIAEMIQKEQVSVVNIEEGSSSFGLPTTTAPMNLFVDAALGNDITGNGSSSQPYSTPTRAFDDVPFTISHPVHVRIAGGAYTDFPSNLSRVYEEDGQLTIEGTGPAVTLFGPYTVTTHTLDFNWTHSEILVAAAGWAVDQFYGKFIRMTSGAATGRRFAIFANSTDTIICPTINTFAIGNINPGDTFEIVDPPVTINVNHGVQFEILHTPPAPLTAPASIYDDSRLGLGALKFVTTATYFQEPFTFVGGSHLPNFVCFEAPAPPVWWQPLRTITIKKASVGGGGLLFASGFDDAFLTDLWDVAFQCVSGPFPPVGTDQWFSALIDDGFLSNFVTREGLFLQGQSGLIGACVGRIQVVREANVNISTAYVDSQTFIGGTQEGIRLNWDAFADMSWVHIENISGQHAMGAIDTAAISMIGVTGNVANIPGYAVSIGSFVRVLDQPMFGALSGTTGDLIFTTTAAAFAWPAAVGSVTDGHGAIALVK